MALLDFARRRPAGLLHRPSLSDRAAGVGRQQSRVEIAVEIGKTMLILVLIALSIVALREVDFDRCDWPPSRRPDNTSVWLPSAAEPVPESPEGPEVSAIGSFARLRGQLGVGGDELLRPATFLMDHHVETVDHQLDRRRRLGTFSTRVVDSRG